MLVTGPSPSPPTRRWLGRQKSAPGALWRVYARRSARKKRQHAAEKREQRKMPRGSEETPQVQWRTSEEAQNMPRVQRRMSEETWKTQQERSRKPQDEGAV
ncbi:hypothetical protein NDU88_003083 [Pleurodeles waltl]|uniref:Uncharacterized protein n=1 Tax=Pleurodeles waltl TaxID=8319 RepID=A0AAV7V1E9_PLEWA|nr:hypothetical protein NDU88_003083 [Pleurodeles waltl]